jgi:hypothetical protein
MRLFIYIYYNISVPYMFRTDTPLIFNSLHYHCTCSCLYTSCWNIKINTGKEQWQPNDKINNHLDEISVITELLRFKNKIYQTKKGVAKDSPVSSTIAEIFLKHLEGTHIKQLLNSGNIIFYTRYVDDILNIYDTAETNSDLITNYINQIHKDIQLNPTHETNNSTNFLDLLIIRKTASPEIDNHRKPTTTDRATNFYLVSLWNIKLPHTDITLLECTWYY